MNLINVLISKIGIRNGKNEDQNCIRCVFRIRFENENFPSEIEQIQKRNKSDFRPNVGPTSCQPVYTFSINMSERFRFRNWTILSTIVSMPTIVSAHLQSNEILYVSMIFTLLIMDVLFSVCNHIGFGFIAEFSLKRIVFYVQLLRFSFSRRMSCELVTAELV